MAKLQAALWILCVVVSMPALASEDDFLMGNPTEATADPNNRDNFLMNKEFFTLSYNNSKGTPNWVSWHLTKSTIGNLERPRVFATDESLPFGFTRHIHRDYNNTGFDRGHMCPHADRALTAELDASTFVMTNIIPQCHENNAGAWERLENYCRYLVLHKGKELYIIAGPAGIRGEGRQGWKAKIAGSKITVPHLCWKVIMVLNADDSRNDLSRVDHHVRLIAVITPNDSSCSLDHWAQYRHSVREVEELTGFRFFDRVPPQIIEPLKDDVDDETIPQLHNEHD